jgi:hypothetical protein
MTESPPIVPIPDYPTGNPVYYPSQAPTDWKASQPIRIRKPDE